MATNSTSDTPPRALVFWLIGDWSAGMTMLVSELMRVSQLPAREYVFDGQADALAARLAADAAAAGGACIQFITCASASDEFNAMIGSIGGTCLHVSAIPAPVHGPANAKIARHKRADMRTVASQILEKHTSRSQPL